MAIISLGVSGSDDRQRPVLDGDGDGLQRGDSVTILEFRETKNNKTNGVSAAMPSCSLDPRRQSRLPTTTHAGIVGRPSCGIVLASPPVRLGF